jgi:hypothetical protein
VFSVRYVSLTLKVIFNVRYVSLVLKVITSIFLNLVLMSSLLNVTKCIVDIESRSWYQKMESKNRFQVIFKEKIHVIKLSYTIYILVLILLIEDMFSARYMSLTLKVIFSGRYVSFALKVITSIFLTLLLMSM